MGPAASAAGAKKVSYRLGLVGVAVFAFGALGGTALAYLGLLLLLIATSLAPEPLLEWGRRCRGAAWLAITFCVLVVAATATAMLTMPIPWALQRDGAVDLLLLLLFPLVAVWTAGDQRRVLWALGLALLLAADRRPMRRLRALAGSGQAQQEDHRGRAAVALA